jgi:hypothetical protein
MKGWLTLLACFLLPLLGSANMSNPVSRGTLGASSFCANHVDILRETIKIVFDKSGKNAKYEIEYQIQSDSSGVQIPLLFYAYDLEYNHRGMFREDFRVWVDGEQIETFHLPQDFATLNGAAWASYDQVFHQYIDSYISDSIPKMIVYLPDGESDELRPIPVSDLRYFETDIASGQHTIRVTYSAKPWENRIDYIKGIWYRYALSPAKTWRSFGELEVTVDSRACDTMIVGDVFTNLGPPTSGKLKSVATWKFSSIPVSVIELRLVPHLSDRTQFLLRMRPFGFLIAGSVLMFLLQFFLMWLHRRRRFVRVISGVNILGSIFGLLAILSIFLSSPIWISSEIPSDFQGYGDPYLIFFLVFNPIGCLLICVLYFTLNWVIDWRLRVWFRRKNKDKSA